MRHRYHFGEHPEMPWRGACDPWEGLSPWRRWVEIQRLRHPDMELLLLRILASIVLFLIVVLLRSLRPS